MSEHPAPGQAPLTRIQSLALQRIREYVTGAGEGAGAAWLARRLGCSRTYARALARVLYRKGYLQTEDPPYLPIPDSATKRR